MMNFILVDESQKPVQNRKLKTLNPEIILDLTGSMISASLIFNIKAKQIIGINRKQFSAIYDHFVELRKIPQLG